MLLEEKNKKQPDKKPTDKTDLGKQWRVLDEEWAPLTDESGEESDSASDSNSDVGKEKK